MVEREQKYRPPPLQGWFCSAFEADVSVVSFADSRSIVSVSLLLFVITL